MKTYTQEEINKIIKNHQHWLKEDCEGWMEMRANLSGANLSGADLSGSNLSEANLSKTYLSGANLSGTYLSGANLSGANLSRVDLSGSNLSGANLFRANLSGANLSGSNLSEANLSGTYLSRVDLSGSNLSEAKNVPYIPLACPSEGEFIGWKKGFAFDNKGNKNNCLIKLLILSDAKRSSATTNKCRCDKAKVISIEISREHISFNECYSIYDPKFIYKVGEIVSVDNFDDDRFNECAPGIHFFINKEEAIRY